MDHRFTREYQAHVLKERGLSADEIADTLGLKDKTVRSYASRGRSTEAYDHHRRVREAYARRKGHLPRQQYIAIQNAKSWWAKDGRIATLKRLWVTDMWVAEIAATLGTTRNAIIGKAHRLGLPRKK